MGLPDPHSYGSKNPGATNVLRTGNRLAAVLTLVGDAGKGAAAVLLTALCTGESAVSGYDARSPRDGAAGPSLSCLPTVPGRQGRGDRRGCAARSTPAPAWARSPPSASSSRSSHRLARVDDRGGFRRSSGRFLFQDKPISFAVLAIVPLVIWRHRVNAMRLVAGTGSPTQQRRHEDSGAGRHGVGGYFGGHGASRRGRTFRALKRAALLARDGLRTSKLATRSWMKTVTQDKVRCTASSAPAKAYDLASAVDAIAPAAERRPTFCLSSTASHITKRSTGALAASVFGGVVGIGTKLAPTAKLTLQRFHRIAFGPRLRRRRACAGARRPARGSHA